MEVTRSTEGHYRGLLRNRKFVLWQASATASGVGYAVYSVSVPWLALEISGSLLAVGLVLFVEVGVYTLTFLVGPLVDRSRNKRSIFLACYPAQAAAAGAIGLALAGGFLSIPLLLGLIAFISLLWDFAWATNNVVPRLLLTPDELFPAEGLGSVLGGATALGGYSAGALLVILVGPAGGMLLYAGFLGLASLLVLPLSLPSPGVEAGRYLAAFSEGWRYFTRRAGGALRSLAAVELVRGFFSTAPTILIVLMAARDFAGTRQAYGALYAAWVVGGIVVGLLLGRWNPRQRVGGILAASAFASGLFVVVAVSWSLGLPLSSVLWFLVGASGTAYLSSRDVYLRATYPPEAIGRVSANLYLFTGAASSIGALVIGELATAGPGASVGWLVGGGLIAAGVLTIASPRLRQMAF